VNAKTPERRPAQSEAAKERVRRHLAGEPAPPLDPVEAVVHTIEAQSHLRHFAGHM